MDLNNPTELLTPDQRKQQASVLMEQAKRLSEESEQIELGEVPATADKKDVSVSKWIINLSFIVFGIAGIIGSFWSAFDMMKFVEFLKVFAYIWAPLVLAVGAGRSLKTFYNKKYGETVKNGETTTPTTPVGTSMYRRKK